MSEYQYYEFQAIDRPLDEADREALRALSTRARITATSFTNHYEWGDFKGDPKRLMAHWFDLHLYLANWGTRRLMIRLPKRLVDRPRLASCLHGDDLAELVEAGDYLILDICDDDEREEYEDWDDGSGWLAALAPLRTELLSGDLRLFYLLWLAGVEHGGRRDDAEEPLPGLGPLTSALSAFVEFFCLDIDLVEAAAEAPAGGAEGEPPPETVHAALAAIPASEKTDLLRRLVEGEPHLAAELRRRIRKAASPADDDGAVFRTAGDLRRRAAAIRDAREAAEAARQEAKRLRLARAAAEAQRARLTALRRRGESVWREVEDEIGKRHASGYDRAAVLLLDLKALAEEDGADAGFANRLNDIRRRHARKRQFIRRLDGL